MYRLACALCRVPHKAHVRRGFIKAEETVPKAARTPDLLATWFVGLIGKLFTVEARAAKWTAERRQRLRARYSSRVLAVIEHMMVKQLPTIVPSSLLDKALQYMCGQWPKLVRYVENGNWPISNNWGLPVADVTAEILPLVKRVVDGIVQRAFGRHLRCLLI